MFGIYQNNWNKYYSDLYFQGDGFQQFDYSGYAASNQNSYAQV